MLKRLSFDQSSVLKAVGTQSLLAITTYIISYALLATQKPKFQRVQDPDDAAAAEAAKATKTMSSEATGAIPVVPILRSTVQSRGGSKAWGLTGLKLHSSPKIFL